MESEEKDKEVAEGAGVTEREQGEERVAAASAAFTAAAAAASAPGSKGASNRNSPYVELQKAVKEALESESRLSTSDKVALALEVLRARQLELDLAQTRTNIESLVSSQSMTPRSLRAVVPADKVTGLPVGSPIEIRTGKFTLSPSNNDPAALFLTLELQNYGQPTENGDARSREHS
mmetsp:Transcript_164/g.505  ORF Transcript_164/g.505 Transcript_164/m.505 type:complete len:177 (+) Transcript_164:117-647(+)